MCIRDSSTIVLLRCTDIHESFSKTYCPDTEMEYQIAAIVFKFVKSDCVSQLLEISAFITTGNQVR